MLSEDGTRLDGPRRGSIVEHLGLKDIEVLMARREDHFKRKRLKGLYKHILSQKI